MGPPQNKFTHHHHQNLSLPGVKEGDKKYLGLILDVIITLQKLLPLLTIAQYSKPGNM